MHSSKASERLCKSQRVVIRVLFVCLLVRRCTSFVDGIVSGEFPQKSEATAISLWLKPIVNRVFRPEFHSVRFVNSGHICWIKLNKSKSLTCWPLRGQQVSHQRWISGNVCLCQAWIRLPTLALKPRGDITRSLNQGYQWSNKKDLYSPKIY